MTSPVPSPKKPGRKSGGPGFVRAESGLDQNESGTCPAPGRDEARPSPNGRASRDASLDDKLAALYQRTGGHTIRLGLDTTLALFDELSLSPAAIPAVHIAGTNGKGSVAAMLDSVFRVAGLRSALFTSPHLLRFNERIRIGGVPIPDDALSRLIDLAVAADDRQAARPGHRPATFFELSAAIAFLWFREAAADILVLETGLGGRLDATNIVPAPLVSVLTEIGLEHTAWLGPTLRHIAAEKAGIIKPSCPVVSAPQRPEALEVLRAAAAERRAPFLLASDAVTVRRIRNGLASQKVAAELPSGPLPPFTLPLAGEHQIDNLATALAAIEVLRMRGLAIRDDALLRGLSTVVWPARCQLLSDAPPVLLDSAHNPDAADALARHLRSLRPAERRPVHLVSGMLSDKDAPAFYTRLRPAVSSATLVVLDSPRAMSMPDMLAAASAARLPATPAASLADALREGRRIAAESGGILLVAGSLVLAAQTLEALGINPFPPVPSVPVVPSVPSVPKRKVP